MKLAIDFDGTLVEHGSPLRLRVGALEAIQALKTAGHYLVLFSARSTLDGAGPVLEDEAGRFWQYGEVPGRTSYQWQLSEEMREFLKRVGLWQLFDDVWTSPGKPIVDRFIDDRAEPPDWAMLRQQA
jgi:FMN phosphatase YigB (HAD superfamily)